MNAIKTAFSEAGEIYARSLNKRSQVLHIYLCCGQGYLTEIVLQYTISSYSAANEWFLSNWIFFGSLNYVLFYV